MQKIVIIQLNLGLLIHDIETAWNLLDKAENERQFALIYELQRYLNIFFKL